MRILMLGNSFTAAGDLPQILSRLTGAEVVSHTRGGARLSEHLNPNTKLGARTQAALNHKRWDYVILQEMSNGPITAPERFFEAVSRLCGRIRKNGAVPVLFATWAYQKGGAKLAEKGWDYDDMARTLSEAYYKAALENGALIADVGQQFYRRSENQNLYAPDGVHPNDEGTRVAAETLASVLLTHEEHAS